ncbi:PQQ-dependent sugar dehydrogenase [Pseudomonas saudiphocaensis]|uniref:Hydrophobic compound transport factor n=1 Tax=Pseudomonas saudiphocaensis TaxID=1499686 RepID=A0A078LP31_9PSED|nr:PQQ-dependent sugar dehydrogenase [Pseudomonas saudiphocaensis]CDZ94243.1 hydrophobic compound transport factor [Pseudomonas saudiphocaensis]
MPHLAPRALLCGLALACSSLALGQVNYYDSELGRISVEEVAKGLKYPWALAFLPGDGGMLVTERPGRLRLIDAQGRLSEPLEGVPQVFAEGQGGLLDVQLSPDFDSDRLVYLSYAQKGDEGKAGTAVGRGWLADDRRSLEDFTVIFEQQPKLSTGLHFGARLVFDREGRLFIALGENNQRPTSQDLDKHQGKVVRIEPDGKVPQDNPFVNTDGALPEIWSYGHRNQQGAALNPWSGAVWTHEHGPRGGDEINIPQPGRNYGWPLATHGIDYSGRAISEAVGESAPNTEPPHHVWRQSPAVSGMAFYDAERFEPWQHNLFVGAMLDRSLIRLQLDGDKVVHDERLLKDMEERIRDVRLGPDGYLYLLTDSSKGRLLKVGLADR